LEVEEDMPPAKVLVDDASSDDSPLPLVKPLPLPEYDLGTSPSSPVAEDSESAVPAAELEAKAAGRRERVMNSGLMVKGQQVTGCSLFLRQLQASFMKRVHCAKRDRKTICLQIFMPVAVIIIALALLNIVGPEKPPLELQLTGYTDDVQLTARECGWAADAQYFPTDGVEYDIMDVDDGVGKTEELDKTYYGQGTQYRLGSVLYKDEVLRVQAVNVSGFPTISFHTTTIMHNSTAHHGLPTMYRELNVARLRKATGDSASTIRVTNFPLPLTEQQNTIYNAIITVVAAIFVLIPFTFFPANCVAFVVKEREVKSKHIQNLSGIKTLAYWLATYIFDNLTMLITTILTLMVFVIFDREDVTGDFERMSGALLLFVVYGLASIALGYCFSFLFNNHSLAQNVLMMVNFLFGFVLVLASQVMNSLSQTRGINKRLQYIYRCIPAYSLGEGIIRLSTKRLLEFVDGQEYAVLDAEILGRPLLYMAVMAPFLFALAVFIDSSWFYKLKMKFRRNCHCCTPFCNGLAFVLCCGCCRVCCKKAAVLEDEAGPDKWETAVVEEDADVTAERLAVEDGDGREGDKVTIQHLKKVYDAKGNAPPKTAVHDLSLGVMKDEIFALLGSNGAGKTTTLSMMSGEFPPTGGRILLSGYDIESQRRKAQDNIGYCPQFDALLDYLSVTEHLYLFGRLRGVPEKKLAWAVGEIIDYLGLRPHAKKPSMALSGGNKRKLSIGIAIIGSPEVVFLDEPSSGLDPMARRSLWTCIADLAINRSVILTTHHLEEVESLAHRVTIMMHGRMQCIGSLQHLKSKFGDGYTLQFRIPPEHQPGLFEYLSRHFPHITLEDEDFGKVMYHLPSTQNGQPVQMSRIFGRIQCVAEQFQIEDYSVSQTTLEEVFLRISDKEQGKEKEQPPRRPTLDPTGSDGDVPRQSLCEFSKIVEEVEPNLDDAPEAVDTGSGHRHGQYEPPVTPWVGTVVSSATPEHHLVG
jgi:ABC-type multidrug transport system ATPase subunit